MGWVLSYGGFSDTLPGSEGLPALFLCTIRIFQASREFLYLISYGFAFLTCSQRMFSYSTLCLLHNLRSEILQWHSFPFAICSTFYSWLSRQVYTSQDMRSTAISLLNRAQIPIVGEVRMTWHHVFVVNNWVGEITAGNNVHSEAGNVYIAVLSSASITENDQLSGSGSFQL